MRLVRQLQLLAQWYRVGLLTVGSQVRTCLVTRFQNLDFVRNLLFPLLKNSESVVDKWGEGKMIRELFLSGYLTNRSQYVELTDKKSRGTIIEYGILQGSLLGPRLFLEYINDMSGCVTVGELHLYADDTTAFVIGNNTEEVIDLLNTLARDIYNWCNKNKLTVYTRKGEVLIIQNKSFMGPLLPIKMGATVLKYVTFSAWCQN